MFEKRKKAKENCKLHSNSKKVGVKTTNFVYIERLKKGNKF